MSSDIVSDNVPIASCDFGYQFGLSPRSVYIAVYTTVYTVGYAVRWRMWVCIGNKKGLNRYGLSLRVSYGGI